MMRNPVNILLAEDDESLGYLLKEYLTINDFSVNWCVDGKKAMEAYNNHPFDIAILDIMMPEKDGLTLLKEIKSSSPNFPVILLTAKSLKTDKLHGFKAGADDYMTKPMDEEELVARIKAVLRRNQNHGIKTNSIIQIGKYEFDFANQTLRQNEIIINLSQKESQLLKEFCLNLGNVVERKNILKNLWGKNDFFTRKSMDVFIHKLRKYLKDDPSIQIVNIHGKGYLLRIVDQS